MGKAVRNPSRAVLRLLLWSRLFWPGTRADRRRFLTWISDRFEVDAESLRAEYLASDFHRWYVTRREELRGLPGPQRLGSSGDLALETLYLIVRALRPRVVVETGVLYGASSGHILAALDRNGHGELCSLDLPHEPDEPPHDFLVPDALQGRWTLTVGDSRRELPAVLRRLSAIDMFHHDSLHSFEHMSWEYKTAFPYLTPRGILASHDVRTVYRLSDIGRQNAFPAFCDRHGLSGWVFQNSGFAMRGP
jgi:predicted O-methyltransferase YrrM